MPAFSGPAAGRDDKGPKNPKKRTAIKYPWAPPADRPDATVIEDTENVYVDIWCAGLSVRSTTANDHPLMHGSVVNVHFVNGHELAVELPLHVDIPKAEARINGATLSVTCPKLKLPESGQNANPAESSGRDSNGTGGEVDG